MKKLLLLIAIISLSNLNAQNFDVFNFYNKKSKEVSSKELIKELAEYDVVFIGEHHDNSINHWLEKRITEALFEKKNGQIILGAEMFERDNQEALNSYLAGKIDAKNLKDSVRLWKNYETDYRPLVDFAKDKKLNFIATNVPRKYASQTSKNGIKSLNELPETEKKYIAKLPIEVTLETPGYKEMRSLMGDHVDEMKLMNFVSAQAVKDATMAESIFQNLQSGKTFIHYNGDYHSKQYGGIYWYLKKKNPNLKIAVISVFESEKRDLSLPEKNFVPTEFNLVIPNDMTKTY
ncbi:putative iron-regulated protein [Epilithonimonas hungarica]|uniref:ChaN family lipoprotein n=1 Tax=Epilithonimonas hungarica TaxID=454006 RepID=UPI00278A83BE|nr:ChaN family lipoprotein [Epilithonimonas hungarica]MDP9955534.1 putative iron-regulated protein [Epilithonimonas hungarica]